GGGGARCGQAFAPRAQDDESSSGGVLEGVSLPAPAPPLDGLRGLSAARLADRQRRNGGGVQDSVYPALQALGDALGPCVGASPPGFAGGVSERPLGGSVRPRLGGACPAAAHGRARGDRAPRRATWTQHGGPWFRRMIRDAGATTPPSRWWRLVTSRSSYASPSG